MEFSEFIKSSHGLENSHNSKPQNFRIIQWSSGVQRDEWSPFWASGKYDANNIDKFQIILESIKTEEMDE